MSDCPQCEYHKNRAARWRAEAYRQAGHDVIEFPWMGLTHKEFREVTEGLEDLEDCWIAIEAKLKEKNT
jgi:uroporphyrinogen-III synthase